MLSSKVKSIGKEKEKEKQKEGIWSMFSKKKEEV